MTVDLTAEEVTLLQEILVQDVTRMQTEINRTDHFALKDELRHRQNVLESLARKVGSHDPIVQS